MAEKMNILKRFFNRNKNVIAKNIIAPAKYSQQWYSQAHILAKNSISLREFANTVGVRLGKNLNDLHFGDIIQISESDFFEVLRSSGLDSDTAILVPTEMEQGYEDRINVQLKGAEWVVFFAERGQARVMGSFISYDEALRFVAHCLYESAIISLSASFRGKHFPGAIIPSSGEPWPDGKIRY